MRTAATRYALGLTLALAPGTVLAADKGRLIDPEAFRALVEGRTVHYAYEGEYYGSERFYRNDRATWQHPSGSCEDGRFWDRGTEMCFLYGTTSCWKVFEEADETRRAISVDGFAVEILRIDDQPLRCEGNPVS